MKVLTLNESNGTLTFVRDTDDIQEVESDIKKWILATILISLHYEQTNNVPDEMRDKEGIAEMISLRDDMLNNPDYPLEHVLLRCEEDLGWVCGMSGLPSLTVE
jgi:hypothetical protein